MSFLANQSPIVIDLIIVGIILLFGLIKSRLGLAHSILKVAIFILSIGGGFVSSKFFTDTVAAFAWGKVSPMIDSKVQSLSVEKLIDFSGLSFAENLAGNVDAYLQEQIRSVAMLRAELVTQKICSILLFIVGFIICSIVLNLIREAFGNLTEGSILGWVNHFGGFVLGVVEAVIILTLIVRVAGLLNLDTFTSLSEGTTVLSWMSGGDINATLQAIKDLKLDDLKSIDFSNWSN